MIDYNGKTFRAIENSANGDVSASTVFQYHQEGGIVWAEYSGGDILRGHLIATTDGAGMLDMRYHHVNRRGELMTGVCTSSPEVLGDGRLRLNERWQWTSGDESSGWSIVEEITNLG